MTKPPATPPLPEEFPLRVAFALLGPAVRLAAAQGVNLKDIKHLIELAAYREARRRRLKMREIQDVLGISMSKVGLLSKQLKEHFAQPELEHGLPRAILSLLWGGPLSEQKILQALGEHEDAEIKAALRALVADGRVQIEQGRTVERYTLGAPQHRLVQAPWMARVDALHNLMGSLYQTVQARFFLTDPRAFARTLSFRARPEDVARLQAHYEALFQLICEIDAAAVQADDAFPVQLSMVWAPDEDAPQE